MSECPIVDEDGNVRCTCDVDDLLRLLADSRRREIVSALETHDDNWTDVENLQGTVLTTSGKANSSDLKTEIHHVHLPMLEDRGLIDYDRHSETIRYYRCDFVSNMLEAIDVRRSPVEG
ncbi:hypothetical protein CV102_22110 [Natronococcus pandeyae]|uniref:DUF7344 domain-containing protein n=1 Tax=Natronococcus pandeyae TaxID=2055836 RepID=A0A8J8TQA1_9EURY|nr:ArsR family transcriptional regulator [Natronococcus pandeyae]TYL36519.1 hypothetical protein CV102_22110 [Natronococcus pandeyae]